MIYISIHKYFLHNYISLSLIYINIVIYIIIFANIFFLFFLHDTRFFKTVNEFKNIFTNTYYIYIITLSILSMAGMPPLLGFFSKFFIAIFFFKTNQFFLFFIFLCFNIFVTYFYIINIRFLVTKNNKNYFFIKKYLVYINLTIIFFLIVFSLLNFFSIFFLNDLVLFTNFICSFNF